VKVARFDGKARKNTIDCSVRRRFHVRYDNLVITRAESKTAKRSAKRNAKRNEDLRSEMKICEAKLV
jgi:hypothetical protein